MDTKVLTFSSLGIALLALLLVFFQGRNNYKLGYVNSTLLMERAIILAETKQKLVEKEDEIKNTTRQMEEKLDQFMGGEQEGLTKEEKQKRIQELYAMEMELKRYTSEARQQLADRERELMEPALRILNARIENFAKAKGYDLIWGTVPGGGNILFADNGIDITDQVIGFVNRQP